MSENALQLFADISLAKRLEKAEARSAAEFVEARTRAFPERAAQWIEVAGAYAMYDGAESPLTQTFCLGLFEPVTAGDVERLEKFFEDCSAPVFHEVSPLADPALPALLHERGYRPFEFSSVMFRSIQRGVHFASLRNDKIRVRLASASEHDLWAQTAALGWSEFPEFTEFMLELAQVSAAKSDALSFFAELDGKPIATGSLSICEGVALLAGASTIPEGRKQGAQLALLDSRLRFAAEQGCDVAMIVTLPGSDSQRNAERQGFRIAYTRIKWELVRPGE
ncbi:MAG: GNAT family N-acetyltransferase [bacterium]